MKMLEPWEQQIQYEADNYSEDWDRFSDSGLDDYEAFEEMEANNLDSKGLYKVIKNDDWVEAMEGSETLWKCNFYQTDSYLFAYHGKEDLTIFMDEYSDLYADESNSNDDLIEYLQTKFF